MSPPSRANRASSRPHSRASKRDDAGARLARSGVVRAAGAVCWRRDGDGLLLEVTTEDTFFLRSPWVYRVRSDREEPGIRHGGHHPGSDQDGETAGHRSGDMRSQEQQQKTQQARPDRPVPGETCHQRCAPDHSDGECRGQQTGGTEVHTEIGRAISAKCAR